MATLYTPELEGSNSRWSTHRAVPWYYAHVQNFEFCNATRIVFGRGQIRKLSELIAPDARVLLLYGGGSIRKNGVYDQVVNALGRRTRLEFGGIEANPDFDTLMRAVELVRQERIDFLLSVGGGSVLDGTKFVAAAVPYSGNPWDILAKHGADVKKTLPIGAVLTLPATGSESNGNSVISRRKTGMKWYFASELVYPKFSILDPETTFSLPKRQVVNGIVDAFVHVMEQYATFPADAPLQDRQAEAVLSTLIEVAQPALAEPPNYEARATFMWCTTQALNMLIGCGVPQDWATHEIGHELTALYGLDHAVTLAIVLPGVLAARKEAKRSKLEQLGKRVFGVGTAEEAAARVEQFFRDVGIKTRLSEHGIDAEAAASEVARRFGERGTRVGEHGDIDGTAAAAILRSRA